MKRVLLLLVVSLTAAPALAQAPPTPHAPATLQRSSAYPAPCILPTMRFLQSRAIDLLALRLKLDEQQKEKVLALLTKSEEDAAPLVEAQRAAAKEFADALVNPDTKQADLTAAADKAIKAEMPIMAEKIKTLFALRELLTSEQNKLLTEMLEQTSSTWRSFGDQPQPPAPAPPAQHKQ